jgi:hypothetical protein
MKDRAGRKEAKKRRNAAKAESRDRKLARAGRIATVGMSLTVGLGLALGLFLGAPRLEAKLAARAASGPVEIVFHWPEGAGGESWLPRDLRDVMLASAHQELEKHPDPFSAVALRGVGQAAMRSGWVDEVRSVQRLRSGGIQVDARWRVPTAVVRRDGSDYLIGHRGEVLPMVFRCDASPLKAIVGAAREPRLEGGRPAIGQVWPGADVQAGLELLALVVTKPWADQVSAIDVGEYLSRKELVLVTRWNGKVVWGGAPSDTIPGQLSTAAKLGRLDALYQRHGRIDVSKRLVDITSVYTLVEDTATANAQP